MPALFLDLVMNAPRSPRRGGERTVHIVFWTLILLAALLPLLGFLGTEGSPFALVFPGWAAAVLAVLLPLIPVLAGSILLARRRGWGGALLAGGLFLLLLLSLSGVYDAIGELAAKESLVIPARLLPLLSLGLLTALDFFYGCVLLARGHLWCALAALILLLLLLGLTVWATIALTFVPPHA